MLSIPISPGPSLIIFLFNEHYKKKERKLGRPIALSMNLHPPWRPSVQQKKINFRRIRRSLCPPLPSFFFKCVVVIVWMWTWRESFNVYFWREQPDGTNNPLHIDSSSLPHTHTESYRYTPPKKENQLHPFHMGPEMLQGTEWKRAQTTHGKNAQWRFELTEPMKFNNF